MVYLAKTKIGNTVQSTSGSHIEMKGIEVYRRADMGTADLLEEIKHNRNEEINREVNT